MMDPELAALVDVLPVIDLSDPVAAREAFEQILVAIRIDIPGIETLEIEDRKVPGWDGDPDVAVRVYRPRTAATGAGVPGIVMIHGDSCGAPLPGCALAATQHGSRRRTKKSGAGSHRCLAAANGSVRRACVTSPRC